MNKEASSRTVTAGAALVTPGQSVTLTAAVQPVTAGAPTGSVAFFDNGVQIGSSVALTGQRAGLTTSALAPGTQHVITVSYSGDTNFSREQACRLP